jgi:adenosine deaminase
VPDLERAHGRGRGHHLADHPSICLAICGFAVTVNTDNRLMSDVTVSSEYRALADHFGWDDDAFARANRHAVEAAFCDDDTRCAVRARLNPPPA